MAEDRKVHSILPPCFCLLHESEENITGTVSDEDELKSVLEVFERCYMASFAEWSQRRKQTQPDKEKRILWCDDIDANYIIPSIVESRYIKRCAYGGKPRERQTSASKQIGSNKDHQYIRGRRFHMQSSRKVGCEAKVYIKTLILFEDFKLPKAEASKRGKDKMTTQLRHEANANSRKQILVTLPKAPAHTGENHLVSLETAFTHQIHESVRDKIHQIVGMGILSVPVIKKMLREFVMKELCNDGCLQPMPHDTAYFPKTAVIRRHVHAALGKGCYTNLDQDKLEGVMRDLEQRSPGKHQFYLRKCQTEAEEAGSTNALHRVKDPVIFPTLPGETVEDDDDEDTSGTFLFIHQTVQQKALLQKYGKMVCLDATYKTSKYALPLFLLVVRTNTGYTPVAEFMTETESRTNIEEALHILKKWNPDWEPHFFMLDYSDEEYQALQRVFPDTKKYLCSFHREQAWQRWLKRKKNGIPEVHREIVLQLLRSIASSNTEEDFKAAVCKLQTSEIYTTNRKLQEYLTRYWLAIPERWCALFAGPGFKGLITTNNGVESLNHSLKGFLNVSGNGSLSCLIRTMIGEFLEHHWIVYVQQNYESSSAYKPYSTAIPEFLHNRPKSVVMKCVKAYAAAAYCQRQQIKASGAGGCYTVQSEETDTVYQVSLGTEDFPSCSCPDFSIHRLPCKHLFALFLHDLASWDDFPLKYKSSPYLNLDPYVLSKEVLDACNTPTNTVPAAGPDQEQSMFTETGTDAQETCVEQCPVNLNTAQSHFRELLKEMVDLTFICPDPNLLVLKAGVLTEMRDVIKESIPKQSGLLLHQGVTSSARKTCRLPLRSRKKRTNAESRSPAASSKKRKRMSHQTKQKKSSQDLSDEPPSTDTIKGILKKTAMCNQPLKKKHVQWKGQQYMLNVTDPLVAEHTSDNSIQLVREKIYHVHGLAISYQNLCTLNQQEWLDDVIVDGFLFALMAKQNRGDIDHVFVISASVTTLWQQHGRCEDNMFSSVNMELFKWIFAPICHGMNHWIMLAVDMVNKTVSVLDSIPNRARKETAIQYWKDFYATRSEKPIHWKEGPLRSAKQTYGCSCGPFILMNAHGIINTRDLTRYTTANAKAFRGVVLHTLVNTSTTLPGMTTGCDMPDCPVRSRQGMVCCVCGRWIQWEHCGGLTQRPIGAYVCLICSAQYSQ